MEERGCRSGTDQSVGRKKKSGIPELAAGLLILATFALLGAPVSLEELARKLWSVVLFLLVLGGILVTGVLLLQRAPGPKPRPPLQVKVHRALPHASDLPYPLPGPPPLSTQPSIPSEWSLALVNALEWKRFEELTAAYFRAKGYNANTTRCGPDGGVDIEVAKPGSSSPLFIVQCKAWNSSRVGVKPVRELLGVRAARKVPLALFVTSGEYTPEAREFAATVEHLKLLTGRELLSQIKELPVDVQQTLLREITRGDYTTPTCPSCDVKMVRRTAKRGPNAGSFFWGCPNYPRCKQKFHTRQKC
jgi:restriction system protein